MMPALRGFAKLVSGVFFTVPMAVAMKTKCSSSISLTGRIAVIFSPSSSGKRLTIGLPREARDVIDTEFPADGKLRQDVELPAEVKPTAPIAVVLSGSVYETGGRTVTRTLHSARTRAAAPVVEPAAPDAA